MNELFERVIDKNIEDLDLLEYLVAVVAFMEDYHWYIEGIVENIPDRCDEIDNSYYRDIPFNTVYCYSTRYGMSPDLFHGDMYLPIPETNYFLKLNFES